MVATRGRHLADLPDLYLSDVRRSRVVGVSVVLEGEQLGGGTVIFISVEGHALEANPLLEPLWVRRWSQLVSFVLEVLKLPGGYLVRLSVELRLELGGHPAYPPPSRMDSFAQHHPEWGLDFSYQWERGLLVHHLADLGRKRGPSSATMAGPGPAVGSSRRVVALLGLRRAAAPGSPTGP